MWARVRPGTGISINNSVCVCARVCVCETLARLISMARGPFVVYIFPYHSVYVAAASFIQAL